MITGVLVALGAAALAFLLSGARSSAALAFVLGYVPFLTLDGHAGGLEELADLGAGNARFKLAARMLASGAFLVLLLRRRDTLGLLLRPAALPVAAFVTWGLLSVHRAQAPWVSLFRLLELAVFFLGGVVLLAESGRFHPPRRTARLHCLALLQFPLAALAFAVLRPELAYFEDARGIGRLGHRFLNANTLGFASAVVLLWALAELLAARERRRAWWFERGVPALAATVGLGVLLAAHSRTATVCAALGLLVLAFPFEPRRGRRVVLFAGLLAVVGAAVYLGYDGLRAWFLRGESAASFGSGAGRTALWAALLSEEVPRAPLLGAGYLMLGEDGRFLHAGRLWNNAHNTYVYALVSNGVPGLVCTLVIAGAPWIALLRRRITAPRADRPAWTLFLALQSMVLVASVTGFGITGHPNPVMYFHYGLYALALLAPVAARTGHEERVAARHPGAGGPPRAQRSLGVGALAEGSR